MLNLRQLSDTNRSQTGSHAQYLSEASTPRFRPPSDLIGNIGEPLEHGQGDEFELDEGESQGEAAAPEQQPDSEPEPVAGPSAYA